MMVHHPNPCSTNGQGAERASGMTCTQAASKYNGAGCRLRLHAGLGNATREAARMLGTCWELAVEAEAMCSYVAAVCLTGLATEAAVNPAQLRVG